MNIRMVSYIYLACRQHAMQITFSAQAAQNPTIERL